MISLKYIAGVSGNEYDLKSDGLRTKTANYHKWTFGRNTTALQYGERLNAFTKNNQQYETTLYVKGGYQERENVLTALHEDFELDILNTTPGRIVWGDWYIDCYMVSSSTYPGDGNVYTINDVVIYTPYPFWIKEAKKSFYARADISGEQDFLDYKYDYDYDYTYADAGFSLWNTNHPFESEFRLTIYGAVVTPRILIGAHVYQVNYTAEHGEYIVIDSRENTVTLHRANGTQRNIYNYRYLEQSIFEKIPGGVLSVYWSGGFGFDLLLYQERSEPTWRTSF